MIWWHVKKTQDGVPWYRGMDTINGRCRVLRSPAVSMLWWCGVLYTACTPSLSQCVYDDVIPLSYGGLLRHSSLTSSISVFSQSDLTFPQAVFGRTTHRPNPLSLCQCRLLGCPFVTRRRHVALLYRISAFPCLSCCFLHTWYNLFYYLTCYNLKTTE